MKFIGKQWDIFIISTSWLDSVQQQLAPLLLQGNSEDDIPLSKGDIDC